MKIEEFAKKLVKQQIKTPKTFLIIFAIISLLMVPGIFKLVNNVEPSLEKVLPQNIEEIKTMNEMRSQFGADMVYIVIKTDKVEDIRNPSVLRYIDILASKLRTNKNILEIMSIADLVNPIPNTLKESKEILTENFQSSMLLNSAKSLTIMQIRTDTGATAGLVKEVLDNIKFDILSVEKYNPGVNVDVTGFSAIDKATFEIIMSDFAIITLISMIAVMIIVWITFKKLSKGMLPMIVVMNALLWTMGLTGYFGFTITVVTMVAAAMIMGLGIDFGIHIVHTYFELRNKNSKTIAMSETMQELLRAMTAASFTTTAGFLALLFGVLPAMKILGIVLAIGIISTLIGATFLLPAIIYLYDNQTKNIRGVKI